MKKIVVILILLFLLIPIKVDSIQLEATWDESPSAMYEKIRYWIYFKDKDGIISPYKVDANSTCYIFDYNPKKGQQEIWVTAKDMVGLESEPSNSLVIKIPECPNNMSIRKAKSIIVIEK
jgi:hypothetical protein